MRKAMTWVTATVPVLRQGAGLANVGAAVSADSYILMGEDATKVLCRWQNQGGAGRRPGKDRPLRVLLLHFNLTESEQTYALSGDLLPRICLRMRGSPPHEHLDHRSPR